MKPQTASDGLNEHEKVINKLIAENERLRKIETAAKAIDAEWFIDYEECPEEVRALHEALGGLEAKTEASQLEERYGYLIGEMAKMETPSTYYATYALFADSLRADIRRDIEALGDGQELGVASSDSPEDESTQR